jgi:hypothetical protein
MVVMEKGPELDIRATPEADLVVEPKDISFQDVAGGAVLIQVKIRNDGEYRSQPTFIRLESAPLGAFVPWRPLAIVPVPALEPGLSRILITQAIRPRLQPLGDFDGVPPTRLLAAVNSPDESFRQTNARLLAMRNLMLGGTSADSPSGTATGRGTLLAPDLMELLGRGKHHWAGNINVFIGNKAVERHLAKALRIHAGRPNLAVFMVGGSGKSDAYAFEIVGATPEWSAGLYDMTQGTSLLPAQSAEMIPKTQWVKASFGQMIVMLKTSPPADCKQGAVEVRVTQRSSGKTAVVEFDLDPAAQGPGCYCA